ncbi:hypothetical protein BDP27DRAFT_1423687 [Rhodocollybia butyracea]|uniref:Uncharacterized protein n=1 Tax=Rhodocollybia butyracea TaxID=206335 RepID=A0A9P5U4D9_9AGAR|nr:hypothetical protein BDP27DRAFT_1423687 [Rhodocollybia butyracea]
MPPPSSWSFFPGENVKVGLGYGQGGIFIQGKYLARSSPDDTPPKEIYRLVKICQSVPPIKVQPPAVHLLLEGFVSASNTKHVEVWIPELELVLNIDHNCLHYQPNLTALGKHLDLTKLSPNLKPKGPLPITPHTGVSPWKDLCVCVVGGTELDQWGGYKPVELIKGLCCTILDVKVNFATHSGLAVLVRPDGCSTTSWVDYSRLRRDDNHCFFQEDQHGSSRPLHYGFKRGYVPSYSDQELLALNGYLNPEYKAKMAQVHRQWEEEEQRKEGIETGDGEYLVSKEANFCTDSPPPAVGGGGGAELKLEHWILDPCLKEALGEQSIYVATTLSQQKDYLPVNLWYGSKGQVEVWTHAPRSQKLNLEDLENETRTRTLLDQRYERNLLVVVQGEHTGKFVHILSVGWTQSLQCQRVQLTGLEDKAGKEYREDIIPEAPFFMEKSNIAVVKQMENAKKVGNKLMQTLRNLEREKGKAC